MNKIVKYLLIISGVLAVLIIAAALIIPQLIDIKQYKPVIEKKVAQATGLDFSMGEDMDISVFPWVVIRLTDLRLGNPAGDAGAGFTEKDMISIKNFEIRLKFLPLLLRKIEIKKFVIDKPLIHLERLKNGLANWESIGKADKDNKTSVSGKKDITGEKSQTNANNKTDEPSDLPITSLLVNTFSVTGGQLIYIDKTQGLKQELSDLNLELDNISFDKAISLLLNATLVLNEKPDNKPGEKQADKSAKLPVSIKGHIGPIGKSLIDKNSEQKNIALDLTLEAVNQLKVNIKGNLTAPLSEPGFDLHIAVSPFSPAKLIASLNQPLPFNSKDFSLPEKLGLSMTAKGDTKNISLTSGKIALDNSNIDFTAQAKDFHLPNLKFEIQADSIDLDSYLPASDSDPEKDAGQAAKQTNKQAGEKAAANELAAASTQAQAKVKDKKKQKNDYTSLRKLILDGSIKIDRLKAKGAVLENLNAHIFGRNGIININPLKLDLYKGILSTKTKIDISRNTPQCRVQLDMKGVQLGALLKDAAKKEIIKELIDGQMHARQIALSMKGDTPDMIKNTLTGEGEILVTAGTIIGIDLADTVGSLQTILGLSRPDNSKDKPGTDFAELKIPFQVDQGLVNIDGTSIISPFMRVKAGGTLHLAKEELNLKVIPKIITTIKGQGNNKEKSGLTVPVSIKGSFDKPKIRPDLKGILNEALTTDPKKLKDKVLDTIKGKDSQQDIGKQIKNIFKVFGN